jgi:NADP-dependent 3-hydroxy acid dehydrogenase YdfG
MHRGVAVVTGASSGIGAATARHLAKEGFDVVVGARRFDRVRELADTISGTALPLDVDDDDSVDAFCDAIESCRVLVNNAGGAFGLEPVEKADLEDWQRMFDTNVLGTVRMTKTLLPKLEATGDGHIVLMGSVAGLEGYIGGSGYNAAKFAVHALHQVLRMELLGRPIRVTEIDPGACETEFSLVRFEGDAERAARVYEGLTPLTADDVAECVTFAVTRPSHVNIDQIVLMPRDQANARMFHRRPS